MPAPNKPSIFRQKANQNLSSPDQLDQLMQVIEPKGWWWLNTLGLLVIGAVIWSIFGRISTTVTGVGILISPREISFIQSESSGRLTDLKVDVGDIVEKGDVIATVAQPELEVELAEKQKDLEQLEKQFEEENKIQAEDDRRQLADLKLQRESYQQQLEELTNLQETFLEANQRGIEAQKNELTERIESLETLNPILAETLETQQKLFEQELITQATFLQAQTQYIDNQDQIRQARSNLTQLEEQEAGFLQQYLTNQNNIIQIQSNLRQIQIKENQLRLNTLQTLDQQVQQTEAILDEIGQIQEQLKIENQVTSTVTGKILSLEVNRGDVINPGSPIARIVDHKGAEDEILKSIVYFNIGDGKKIEQGMVVEVTPSVVTRERFGGIVGTVSYVAVFPVSLQEATATIGDSNLAQILTNQERNIQVEVELKTNSDTYSGYKWSSGKGPQISLSPGTTTTATVVVEQRAPITYVIPLLRSITGVEN